MYTNVRPYVFLIPTVCSAKNAANEYIGLCGWNTGSGEDKGRLETDVIDKIKTIGNQDLQVRLTRMIIAIKQCIAKDGSRKLDVETDKNTLRVFVAPEFYFRPPQKDLLTGEAYSRKDADKLYDFLGWFFKKYAFIMKNWLVLCGTVLYNDQEGVLFPTKFVQNDLLAFEINNNSDVKPRRIKKACVSDKDGIDGQYVPPKYIRRSEENIRNHYFIDQKLFVEICLEHNLDETIMQYAKKKGLAGDIKRHVITAGGMPIQEKNCAYNTDIIRSDGMLRGTREKMVDY
ncbi:MAG: hypothetical protein K6G30_07255, partial [Acetatifactor sp.]|nr:hypothetical protein [Acetatifactor sp.]